MARLTLGERLWGPLGWDKSGGPDACWPWAGSKDNHGYGQIKLLGRAHRPTRTHRLAWALKHGPIPLGSHVLHSCDNRACGNPSHLLLGTHTQNMADMKVKGRDDSWGHKRRARCLG